MRARSFSLSSECTLDFVSHRADFHHRPLSIVGEVFGLFSLIFVSCWWSWRYWSVSSFDRTLDRHFLSLCFPGTFRVLWLSKPLFFFFFRIQTFSLRRRFLLFIWSCVCVFCCLLDLSFFHPSSEQRISLSVLSSFFKPSSSDDDDDWS